MDHAKLDAAVRMANKAAGEFKNDESPEDDGEFDKRVTWNDGDLVLLNEKDDPKSREDKNSRLGK